MDLNILILTYFLVLKRRALSIAGRQDRLYGLVKKIIQNDEKAQVSWVEDKDNTNSIEDVLLLQLETLMPHEKSPKSTPLRGVSEVVNPSPKEKQVAEQKINKKSLIFA